MSKVFSKVKNNRLFSKNGGDAGGDKTKLNVYLSHMNNKKSLRIYEKNKKDVLNQFKKLREHLKELKAKSNVCICTEVTCKGKCI
jgi:hypothetical protein